jgi:hypothetical protein
VHKSGPDRIGSLLLGLYNDEGSLASVGVIGAFPMAERQSLFVELQSLVTTFDGHPWNWVEMLETVRNPRAYEGSRWNNGKDLSFVPLRPSGWSRSGTTTWKASGSGTPPSSSAGCRTAPRSRARSPSSTVRCRTSWATSCPA